MRIFDLLLVALWTAFLVIWVVAAFQTKRYVHRTKVSWIARVVAILVVFGFLRFPPFRHIFAGVKHAIWSPALATIGIALVVLGIGFATWARVQIGRNWGTPMSLKEDPELVTSGPYASVRHPICGGILVAMLGSTLVNIWSIVPLVLLSVYFVRSAKTEEKIMSAQFPQQYPDYMARTKMFFPFIF